MRDSVLAALAAVLVWAALALLVLPLDKPAVPPDSPHVPAVETAPAAAKAPAPLPQAPDFDRNCRLAVQTEQGIRDMDLQTYLTGVLLAEMPVSFAEEALKAQAVACRTYTMSRTRHSRHENAAVCTDSRCCQGWRDPTEAEPAAREKAEAAVRATDGLVLLYRGQLIDATFFSCSGGRTEDAAAVWGSDLPYLRTVESPGEEDAAHFADELRLPLEDFRQTLTALDSEVSFSGSPDTWIASVRCTAGGGVAELVLGGRVFRGTELRKAFSLRSTAFDLRLGEDGAVFTTRGNGHRVGMSQYGAQAMALGGDDFETILKWYYQGVELVLADG
ncbi:MAG: stage II sporulation protein D [Oscillospiraceae bacterium]|nr:stage II sporulation protein D [Oscillospiraceae bacterium]